MDPLNDPLREMMYWGKIMIGYAHMSLKREKRVHKDCSTALPHGVRAERRRSHIQLMKSMATCRDKIQCESSLLHVFLCNCHVASLRLMSAMKMSR